MIIVILAFFSIQSWYFSPPAAADPHFRHIVPEMSDHIKKTLVWANLAEHETIIKDDAITEWISIAANEKRSEDKRVYAIKRLSDYRQRRIEKGLIPLLLSSSMNVRYESAKVLGKMKFPSSAQVLINSLRFSYGRTRHQIRRSLKEITGQDFGNDYYLWMQWFNRNRREYR